MKPALHRFAPWLRRPAALLLASLLAACGGGDTQDATPPPAAAQVVRVELSPPALLFTAAGQNQRLRLRAFDDQGREITGVTATWSSSRESEVGVDASGTVSARAAVGSGQVTASVNGVTSAPVLVSVARPAEGVVLLADSQIAGTPVAVDPNAEPDVDNPYEVLLTGIAAPAPGTLLLGREGIALGGEVVQATPEAGGVRVRLQPVPLARLMQTAQLKEEIDLRGLPLQLPPEVAALYSVERQGDEYVFTPRAGALASPAARGTKRALALHPFNLGPFKCEVATPELPVSLSQPALFSMKFEPRYIVDYDQAKGLQRLLLSADTSFKLKANLQLNAAALVNVTCETTLYQRLAPLPGWAGLILAGELKAGVGFELEGSVTVPVLGAELTAESKGPMEVGVDCTSGTCVLARRWDPETKNDLRFITPSQALANARSELFVFGYGFGKLKAGLTLVDQARVDVVTARGGLKLEAQLAPEATQLAPVPAGQTDYRSEIKLHALAEVAAGSINRGDSGLRKLLQRLGVFRVNLLKAQISKPLGVSPKGAATVDRGAFADGDALTFKVQIDPQTADFPGLGYNVRRVRILRTADGLLPREVARIEATPGQTAFELRWVAEGTAGESGGGFAAFVDTVLPVPVGLELGPARVVPRIVRGRLSFSDARSTSTQIGTLRRELSHQAQVESDVEYIRPEDNGGFGVLRFVGGKLATGTFETVETDVRRVSGGGTCAATRTVVTTRNTAASSTELVLGQGADTAAFVIEADGTWRFEGRVTVSFLGTTQATRTTRFSDLQGDCSGVDLSTRTEDLPTVNNGFNETFFTARTAGSLAVDANGARSLLFSGDMSLRPGHTAPLTLDLREGASTRAVTDLKLELVAPGFAMPATPVTFAVNLGNTGPADATRVRAEFILPQGWRVTGTTGWSACEVFGTSVICAADALAAGQRQAFLVDVVAPEASGPHTVRARVSADELDVDLADNGATATVEVLSP